jgi:hypothetical protein
VWSTEKPRRSTKAIVFMWSTEERRRSAKMRLRRSTTKVRPKVTRIQ